MLQRGSKPYLRALLFALALLVLVQAAFALDAKKLPKPTGYVSDLAHVVDVDHKQQLEEFCTRVEQQLGVQFALVTIPSLDGQPIRDAALDIFRTWGVGSRKTNQGVLLLLAVQDHQSDIETGYGIEQYLTDGFSGSTLRAMRPDLRAGNYGAALLQAANAMAAQIAKGKGIAFAANAPPPPREEPADHHGSGIPIPLIVFGIFFLIWLLGRGGRRGGGGGGSILPWIIMSNLGGGRGGGWGSGWGGGGFGGGSGGGGGFGGFGGGDAGGGGASSNW